MKMKNHPIRVTLLLLAVFAILLLLRLMPPFELETAHRKKEWYHEVSALRLFYETEVFYIIGNYSVMFL